MANFADPCTCTCETPLTIEMRGAMTFSAKSSRTGSASVFDVRFNIRIGWSFGLFFRNDGGAVIVVGSIGMTAAIAVCTSTAALSILRPRSNCSVMFVLPVPLFDTIESMPAMVVICRSSGLATAEAIVFGSPPGSDAETFSVGYSTCGRSLTGSARYDTTPKSAMAAISRLVAIGRLMKISEMFTGFTRSARVYRLPAPDGAPAGGVPVRPWPVPVPAPPPPGRPPRPRPPPGVGLASPVFGSARVTRVPGSSRSWPSVTTVSPGVRPCGDDDVVPDRGAGGDRRAARRSSPAS